MMTALGRLYGLSRVTPVARYRRVKPKAKSLEPPKPMQPVSATVMVYRGSLTL